MWVYVCWWVINRGCVKSERETNFEMEVKSYFWIWRRKVPDLRQASNKTIIHTPSKLRVYCSIEFFSLFIWVSSSSFLSKRKMLFFRSASYTIEPFFRGVKASWCGDFSFCSFHSCVFKELSLKPFFKVNLNPTQKSFDPDVLLAQFSFQS